MVFNLLEIENKNSIFASGNACICTYNNNNKNNKKQKKKEEDFVQTFKKVKSFNRRNCLAFDRIECAALTRIRRCQPADVQCSTKGKQFQQSRHLNLNFELWTCLLAINPFEWYDGSATLSSWVDSTCQIQVKFQIKVALKLCLRSSWLYTYSFEKC